MIEGLVLHPRTAEELAILQRNPTHAVALIGARGSGKRIMAERLVATLLGIEQATLQNYPYYLILNADETTIPIEQIRELQHFTQLKTIGQAPLRRAIVLLGAGNMTTEAQNAFLKLLEEPPHDTVFILTIENERTLLPTIISRLRAIQVRQAPQDATRAHFAKQFDQAAVDKAYLLSGGLPGLMQALLQDEQSHPLVVAVNQAKEILQKPIFERLTMVDEFSKKKDEAHAILQALRQIAEVGLQSASGQEDTHKIRKWHAIIQAAYEAEKAMGYSANTKLILTNLMLAL